MRYYHVTDDYNGLYLIQSLPDLINCLVWYLDDKYNASDIALLLSMYDSIDILDLHIKRED